MENLKHFFRYNSDIPKGLGVKNFSSTHIYTLCTIFIFIGISIFIYNKLNRDNKTKAMKGFAVSLVMTDVLRTVWAVSIGHYEIDSMLPLHLCGVMVYVEFFAVFSKKQYIKEFAYSCGLPGALIGLIAPEASGYPLMSFRYIIYMLCHGLLVAIPLLWVFGDKFKPNIKYLLKSFSLLCFLAVFDAVVNLMLHSNYLFISRAPTLPQLETFYNYVGYGGYIGLLLFSAIIVLTLMYMPWVIGRKGPIVELNQKDQV